MLSDSIHHLKKKFADECYSLKCKIALRLQNAKTQLHSNVKTPQRYGFLLKSERQAFE